MTVATRADVARLLGRAAFGATRADLDAWQGRPYTELVESLVDIPADRPPQADEERRAAVEEAGRSNQNVAAVRQAQRWWLERMRTTPYPLEERMVLCWHDHFATGLMAPYPDVSMLVNQNEMLRAHALGNFRELALAVTLDPAMLQWLDGARNAVPVPNENYARELLELFTLGKHPQVYNEQDVREAARVLTGWTVEPTTKLTSFNAARHDKGTKTVLGTTIRNGDSGEYVTLVDVALRHEVSVRHVAWTLVSHFAYVPPLTNLLTDADPLVTAVATTLRRTNWDLKSAMRTLLLSDEFRRGGAGEGRVLVRHPAHMAVATARAIGFGLDEDRVADAVTNMGQRLFSPPNVGGWPLGIDWISPATVLARYAWSLLAQQLWAGRPAAIREALPPSGDVAGWAARLGLASVSATTSASVAEYLETRRGASEAEKQAGVLVLLLSSPDWMVI